MAEVRSEVVEAWVVVMEVVMAVVAHTRSSGSGASWQSDTNGLIPLHSMTSRWLCDDTRRLATADAVSRRTASVEVASRARRCETSVDIVVMSTGSTGVSAAQKATSGPSAAAASRLPWATRAQCCTSTSVERISV